MTKSELIKHLALKHALTQNQVNSILNDYADCLKADLIEQKVAVLHGIGRIKLVERAARLGRNPKTGESFTIAAANVVRIAASKDLKALVNE